MREPDFETGHKIETYKGLIQLGTFGLKFVQLVNGGGAVALLAYLGNVSASGHDAPDLTWSMALFLVGLVLGGLAAMTAYLMQLRLYGEGLGDEPPGGHIRLLRISFGLLVLSLLAFGIGSMLAVLAFRR